MSDIRAQVHLVVTITRSRQSSGESSVRVKGARKVNRPND